MQEEDVDIEAPSFNKLLASPIKGVVKHMATEPYKSYPPNAQHELDDIGRNGGVAWMIIILGKYIAKLHEMYFMLEYI